VSDTSTQIHNLLFRYAECIDLGDFDGVADLLADAEVGAAGGPTVTGERGLTAMFTATTRRYADGTPGTKHVTTNVILEADDEAGTATTRSYWTVLQAVPGLPLQPILAGRYHDRFVRVHGTWRFAERRYLIDLVGDLSHHLLTALPATD
jgi:3-phenylpropionate/cinnamic acid dioxygenase small subunit